MDSYQSKQFVQVTEDHLVGPRSKCLSVSDLAYHSFGDREKKQNGKPGMFSYIFNVLITYGMY